LLKSNLTFLAETRAGQSYALQDFFKSKRQTGTAGGKSTISKPLFRHKTSRVGCRGDGLYSHTKSVGVMIKWNAVFKRLMDLMDQQGGGYFSGSRFIKALQEFNEDLPNYTEYIEERSRAGKSTTRRVYYKDILTDLDEGTRVRAVSRLLDTLETVEGNAVPVSEIRKMLGGGTLAPSAVIPAEAWNADRLNEYLSKIDAEIASGEYEHAVTLSYTCLEGFYGAFVRAKYKQAMYSHEIITLSKEVKGYLKGAIKEYPDEVLNGITQAAYAVDKSRNQFSQSHFANEAGSWLATYVRDLVNTQIRLLLHFL
jgi:hypothetical protein